jgi:O-antigen ligase
MKNRYYLFLLVFLVPLVINPWGFSYYEIPKIVYLTAVLLIAVIWILIRFVKNNNLEFKYNKYLYLIIFLWFLSLIVSTLFSNAPYLSFFGSYARMQGLFSHMLYLLFFLIFFHLLFNKDFLKKALKIILGIGILVSLYAFLQKLGIDIYEFSANEVFVGRTFATFGHPNFLGQFLLLPIWISIFLAKDSKNSKYKYLYILIAFILLGALLTTENRASLLGLGVSFIVFILSVLPIKKLYKGLIGGGVVTGGAAFIVLAAPSLRSINSRLVIWKDSLNVIWDNPVFGSGLETFRAMIQKHVSPEIYNYENLLDVSDRAHNFLLDTAVTQGFFGLLIIIIVIGALIIIFFNNNKLLKKKSFGIGAFTLMAVLITMFFSFPLLSDWIVIYTALALFLVPALKYKTIKVKLNVLSVFVSSLLITLLVFANIYTFNLLRADILYNKGLNEFTSLKVNSAYKSFERSIEINPFQDEIHYKAGLFFGLLNNKNVDKYIESAGWFNGKDFQYHIYQGMLLSNRSEFDEAEKYFEIAYEKAPNNAFLWENWGNKYYLEGEYQKSIEAYQKLLELTPEYWMWTIDIDERSEDEKRKYRIFYKTNPNYLMSIERLADSYRQLGNNEKADYYDKFLTIKNKAATSN